MEKKIIVLATSNQHKVKEMNFLLSKYGYKIISLDDLNLKIDKEETGKTFKDNALIKARDISEKTSYPVIADDSGLSINALNGFPGIYSARFMEDKSHKEKCIALNEMLKDTDDKSCSFFCAVAYIDKANNIEKVFIGETKGRLMPEYDDNAIDKFGYDPCFFSNDLGKTFGSSTPEEKGSVSHRSRAINLLIEFLEGKK